MAIDPYASCPCGSGKKFKWCCQPIHAEIEKAFAEHNAGQHEAALGSMKAVVDANAGNPEAWGRYAQLLSANGKIDEAEQAIDKAFAINPHYAFGYLMKGQFRLAEGEMVGGLMLLRKAAEAYSPDAHDQLAMVYELIADLELRQNRPLAARAAMRLAVHMQPSAAELRESYENAFGAKSRLPACARKDYALLAPTPASPEWGHLLEQAATGRLGDVVAAFTKWTAERPDDRAGWYNLGLSKAWLGDNAGALEALERYIDLESDEVAAGEAWALCEVLRCTDQFLEDCDYREHRVSVQVPQPEPVMALLEKWEQARRLVGMRASPEQGMLTGLLLEAPTSLVETAGVPAFAKLAAYFVIAGNMMQLWQSDAALLDKAVAEVEAVVGTGNTKRTVGPAMFPDIVMPAMVFPTKPTTELDAGAHVRESAGKYFEDKWVHQPLKSLGGAPPLDATGSPRLRKKLRGIVRFLEDCAGVTALQMYDFDRLRRKLGLMEGGPASGGADINAMSVAELAALDSAGLTDDQLGDAFRTALKLDAKEVAGKFARAATERPPTTGDRFAFYTHLAHLAQGESKFDDALGLIDEGEKHDCEHNEGKRRNDYELRRGQIHAKHGDAPAAADVFDRLIARAPEELRYLETASKAMIDLKNGTKARDYCEKGLKLARHLNHRDAEEYFLELSDAAKRLG